MTVTITIPMWLPAGWLAVGLLLWLPLEYAAYRQTNAWEGFWRSAATLFRRNPLRSLWAAALAVLVWPLALYEVADWPVRKWWRRWEAGR